MKLKGQVEFFVILGLLFVIVIVVFYGYLSGWFGPGMPDAIAQEQALITTSFENFVRSGAYSVLSTVGENGGYLDNTSYSIGAVAFQGSDRPYWQYFGQTTYPDVPANIKAGIISYIEDNKDAFFETVSSMELIVGDVSDVTVTMTNNQITFDVYLSVSIVYDDVSYAFSQPFSFVVQTNMGQIYDFAKVFTYSQANDRFFETFTLASILISPLESEPPGAIQGIPLFISLTECGQIVLRTWFDIEPRMNDLLHEVVANTYMPGKSPRNNMETSSAPEYEIPTLNDKYYSDLEVWFNLPDEDEFELTPLNFQFFPNPIYAYAKPIAFTGICLSDPVYVDYFLAYPVVVNVRDTLTGSVFRFAHSIYIFDNAAGDWATTPDGYDITLLQEICSDTRCSARVTVQDSSGEPIQGASVSYFGCPLGKTDAAGVLDSSGPCGVGTLEVYEHGYKTYEDRHPSSEMEDITVSLVRVPVKRIHLYEINVRNESLSSWYRINVNDVGPINTLYNHRNEMVSLKFYVDVDEYYSMIFTTMSGRLTHIPAGDYVVSGALTSTDYLTYYGAFFDNYTMTEEDGDLYVYLPYTMDFRDLVAGDLQEYIAATANATKTLSALFEECGLGPISETPVHETFTGCVKTYAELE